MKVDDERCELTIDWDSGEGGVRLGAAFEKAPARFRHDVLSEWKDHIDRLVAAVEAELYPDLREQRAHYQRAQNTRRRELCEKLAGHTVDVAEPLVNGDVLLHLRAGKTVVLYANNEDVKVDVVADVMHARRFASKDGTGDYYVREETPEDRLLRIDVG
ncbi:MAG TPA: hypothetical protein VLU41_05555 [Ideonella sp.]|nr:hypothetical protein [Ideonella sp.]